LLYYLSYLTFFYINLGAKIRSLIEEKNIVGGNLKTYCKTRWTTACECIESILRLELILKEVSIKFNLLFNILFKKLINYI
jgi:hypothetical protein